jgi:ribosomal protein S18 acetylase RimI-like enzyme
MQGTGTATLEVRILGENDWPEYRRIRLESLQESPSAFSVAHGEELERPDSYWRERVLSADRLLAVRGGQALGVVSLHREDSEGHRGEIRDLWVVPEARNTGVAWRLLEAATERAAVLGLSQLSYWVSTENGRAVAFATNFGFRPTSRRRTAKAAHEEFGDQEIALVMTLSQDVGSVPNPTAPRLSSRPGPC